MLKLCAFIAIEAKLRKLKYSNSSAGFLFLATPYISSYLAARVYLEG
jgi:hypothetical protein